MSKTIDSTNASPEEMFIERRNATEYQVHNMPRNERIWVQVENFDLYIKRTDEGIVVDVYDVDDADRQNSLATMCALDEDTQSFQGDI